MNTDRYKVEDIVTLSRTECLLKRPRMYTTNGTAEEIHAFLLGSDAIIQDARLTVRPPTPRHAIDWFYAEANSLGGSLDFEKLREKHGSDEGVIEALLSAIEHFRPESERDTYDSR